MQNNVQIYESIYNTIFDLFSEIGGAAQFIFYIFFWVNYIYNKYIIAYDTYSMFFTVQNDQNNRIDNKIKKGNLLNLNNKIYNSNKTNKYSLQNIINKKKKKNNNNNIIKLNKSKTDYKFIENNRNTQKNNNIKTNYLSKENYFCV